jgi:hypothetical protein
LKSIKRIFASLTNIPDEEIEKGLLSPQLALFLFQFLDYAVDAPPDVPSVGERAAQKGEDASQDVLAKRKGKVL